MYSCTQMLVNKTYSSAFGHILVDFDKTKLIIHLIVRSQVICHGLSLPLSEHDTIRDCVNIYCEWLTALLPSPKLCVPDAVQQRPNHYSRRMLNHLQNLFVPRTDQCESL